MIYLPKAVLLLDNCSAHQELVSSDKKVVAKFLPPNVTALIQPIDQGVLFSIKRRYKRKILEDLVLKDADGMNVLDFLKSVHILHVIGLILSCWTEIFPTTLQRSWRKLFPIEESQPLSSTISASLPAYTDETSDAHFCETLQLIVPDAEETDVTVRLQADEIDLGYTHLDDQEIVEFVVNCEQGESLHNNDDDDDNDCDGELGLEPCQVSHTEAFVCINKLLTWLEKQDECNAYNCNVLYGLCKIAAKNGLVHETNSNNFIYKQVIILYVLYYRLHVWKCVFCYKLKSLLHVQKYCTLYHLL